jgi:serine O-acetyltransferase
VVGIPGRIVHRSGVKVNPLEHGNLPDSEATVIRLLLDRIEALEEQMEELETSRQRELEAFSSNFYQSCSESFVVKREKICHVGDREIEEFLGGTL